MVLALLFVGVLLVRHHGLIAGAGSSQAPQMSSTPGASAAATESVPPASIAASPTPTLAPEPTLTGVVPGPDATVPPGVPVLPGPGIGGLAGIWESHGLTCQSWPGSFPGTAGGYTLHCQGGDATANVDVVAEAVYWTPSAVQTISLSITSHDGQAIDGAAQAKDLFLPSISATVGDSGQAWAQDQIGAAACGKGCSQVMAGGEITVTAGLLGFQQLDVVAVAGGQP